MIAARFLFRPMQKSTHVTQQSSRAVNVNWWIDKKIMHYTNLNSKMHLYAIYSPEKKNISNMQPTAQSPARPSL